MRLLSAIEQPVSAELVFDTFEVKSIVDEATIISPRQTILFQQRDFGFERFSKLSDINLFCEEVMSHGYDLCREDTVKTQFERYSPKAPKQLFYCPLLQTDSSEGAIIKTASISSGKDIYGNITKWLKDFPWSEALLPHLTFENSGWLFEKLLE